MGHAGRFQCLQLLQKMSLIREKPFLQLSGHPKLGLGTAVFGRDYLRTKKDLFDLNLLGRRMVEPTILPKSKQG
jgi:hypothetical protein